MGRKSYKLQYLPLFEDDLNETVDYIQFHLKNPNAAERLVSAVHHAILTRLNNPESFEPYISAKDREDTYYRIYVKHYVIFYVVIDDVMEVRRIMYQRRKLSDYI